LSTMTMTDALVHQGAGPWTTLERDQFVKAVALRGWGNWKLIAPAIPTRSYTQLKLHAQKFKKSRPVTHARLVARAPGGVPGAAPGRRGATTMARRRSGVALSKSGTRPPAKAGCGSRRRWGSAPPGSLAAATATASTRKAKAEAETKTSLAASPAKKTPVACKNSTVTMSPAPAARAPLPNFLVVPPAASAIAIGQAGGCGGVMAPLPLAAARLPPARARTSGWEPSLDADGLPAADVVGQLLRELDLGSVEETRIADVHDGAFFSPWSNASPGNDGGPRPGVARPPVPVTPSRVGPIEKPSVPLTNSAVSFDSAPPPAAVGTVEAFLGNIEIPPHVVPDLQLFADIKSQLTTPPNFNNPKEYVVGEDSLSRIGLEPGALCRVRIKDLLGVHLSTGWWRATFATTNGIVEDQVSFRKNVLEGLIALTTVMLGVSDWQVPRNARDVGHAQAFDDEDDIRHIGQLTSNVWERVNRVLGRNGFALMEVAGGKPGASVTAMERHDAVDQMVSRLDMISRQAGLSE